MTKDLTTLRSAVESKLAVCAARIDRLGLAKKAGSTTSKLLQANDDWDVIMGTDAQPRLIPPTSTPLRRPLPAYCRRTMTLAA